MCIKVRDKGDQTIVLLDVGRRATLGDKGHLITRSQSRNISVSGTDLVLDLGAGYRSVFR